MRLKNHRDHRGIQGLFLYKPSNMYVSLKKGKLIDGHIIQCRIHKARFDIKTGKVIWCAHFPPGIKALIEA